MVEQTEGDPEVNAELKDLPNRIKVSLEGYSRVKAELKKVPKKIMQKIEDQAYDNCVDIFMSCGVVNVGIFICWAILEQYLFMNISC